MSTAVKIRERKGLMGQLPAAEEEPRELLSRLGKRHCDESELLPFCCFRMGWWVV
jgi:hypothetical protein